MNKHLLYITLMATSLWATTACSDESLVQETNTERTPIELSVGVADAGYATRSTQGAMTRAVITDGASKTLRAFEKDTRLFFMMVAEDGNTEAGHTVGTTLYGYNYGKAAGQASPADGSKSTVSHPDDNWLYWDDAYARDTKVSIYSIAAGCLERENSDFGKIWTADYNNATLSNKVGYSGTGYSKVINFNDETTISGASDDNRFITGWSVGTEITWYGSNPGTSTQNKTSFESQDLVFCNNIANYDTDGTDATKDKRLKFHTEAGVMYHKFDKGDLIYYHALTKFTIKIKCGDGFKGDGTDFKFTDNAGTACSTPDNSFAINGFLGRGDFNIKKGEFENHTKSPLKVNYTSIYLANTTKQKKDDGAYYTLNAYVLPGTDLTDQSNNNNKAFNFIIDGNEYSISMTSLYNAIAANSDNKNGSSNVKESVLGEGKKLLAGVNYEFTFTVEKSKIGIITAQVVDWENVTAENITPSNARIKLQLEERGTAKTTDVDFYRAKDPDNATVTDDYQGYSWKTGYNVDGIAPYTLSNQTWTTQWYWPDNTTFYHFRALSPSSSTSAVTTESTNGDYTTITASTAGYTSAESPGYTDVLWGAPMLDDGENETAGTFKWTYSTTNGFDGSGSPHQIYKGIGPTINPIKLILFHTMSEVTFNITTVTDVNAKDYVKLVDGENKTTIQLVGVYPSGKVLMGNGLVTKTGTASTAASPRTITMSNTTNQWIYGAIPQDLTGVEIIITTPDKNEYRYDLKDVLATVSQANINNPYTADGTKYKIDRWYPNFKYQYTFLLKKKGIEKITATILDWENVVAESQDVQIK